MRIGVHCFPLKPQLGGAKHYFLSLFNELLAHDNENEYVFFHAEKNIPALAELASPLWRRQAVPLERSISLSRSLHGVDLYFSPLTILNPRPLRLPTVVSLADTPEVALPKHFSPEEHYLREWHFKGSVRAADKVLTFSRHAQKQITQHYRVSSERIRLTSLCADRTFYEADAARRPGNFDLSCKYLFFPATDQRHKNHEALFGALRLLAAKGLELDVVLCGSGQESTVRELAEQHGLGPRLHWLGYLKCEELAWLYRHAELTVLPSLAAGFALPMLEAMAAGCPVASSNVGALPEMGSDAALYFDPQDIGEIAQTIERICSEPSLRQDLVQRGRLRSEDFSPSAMVNSHMRAFREARRSFSLARYIWNLSLRHPLHAKLIARKYPRIRRR